MTSTGTRRGRDDPTGIWTPNVVLTIGARPLLEALVKSVDPSEQEPSLRLLLALVPWEQPEGPCFQVFGKGWDTESERSVEL